MKIFQVRMVMYAVVLFSSSLCAMEDSPKKLKPEQENTELGEQLVRAAKKGDLEQVKSLVVAGAAQAFAYPGLPARQAMADKRF